MSNSVILSVYCKHKQGGFTKRLYRAYQAIAASDHRLIYVAAKALPVSANNIEAVVLPMISKESSPLYWPEFYLRAIFKLRRLSKEHKVKTHFVFSFFYSTISILASIRLPVQTITLIRGDDAFDARYKSYSWLRSKVHLMLEKIGVRYSRQILATNASMQKAIIQRTGEQEKIGVLPNDITTSALNISKPTQNNPVKFVTVSVLNERKNIHLVIEALAELRDLDWEYLVIGPDTSGKNYGETLQQLAEQKGISDKVHFLGWQDNAAEILEGCHLFILPTLMEGSPNALMEAMGYGLPCLASRIPEVTEVLGDSELHFDPQDPVELREKLLKFITNHEYIEHISQKTSKDRSRYQFNWNEKIISLLNGDNVTT